MRGLEAFGKQLRDQSEFSVKRGHLPRPAQTSTAPPFLYSKTLLRGFSAEGSHQDFESIQFTLAMTCIMF